MRLIIVFLTVFFTSFGIASAKEDQTAEGLFHPKTHKLENGLEIIVVENPVLPVVKAMVWYKVGAADEATGQSGIAHFLEHLLFKGTEKLEDGQLSREIAAVGGSDNAFTSWDYTAYHATIPPSFLPRWLEMEADRMVNAIITEDVVEPERGVILEERRTRVGRSPESQVQEQMRVALFQNHPYNTPIIGWEHEIKKLSTEQILAFYKKWYAPNNAVLSISGQVDADEVFALAEEYFGGLEASQSLEQGRVRPANPELMGQTVINFSHPRITQNKVNRFYRVPSYSTSKNSEAYHYMMLSELLSGSVTSPIYKELVLDRELCFSAFTDYGGEYLDEGMFLIGALPKDGLTHEETEQELMKILADFANLPPEKIAPDLEKVKAKLFEQTVFALDNVEFPARTLGRSVTTGETVADVEHWKQKVAEVTAEDVIAAAQDLLGRKAWVSTYLSPEEASVN